MWVWVVIALFGTGAKQVPAHLGVFATSSYCSSLFLADYLSLFCTRYALLVSYTLPNWVLGTLYKVLCTHSCSTEYTWEFTVVSPTLTSRPQLATVNATSQLDTLLVLR